MVAMHMPFTCTATHLTLTQTHLTLACVTGVLLKAVALQALLHGVACFVRHVTCLLCSKSETKQHS